MAGGQDVRQLLLQVDASVALAQRNLGSLRTTVDREMNAVETAIGKPEERLERLGRAFGSAEQASRRGVASLGQYRAGMQQLGFQLGDVAQQFAAGTSASVIFAQQSGQVVQAIQLMSGGASRFATFMGGPWGIALTAGTVLLAPLIAGLFDLRTELEKSVDELEENARKTELTRQAREAFARTLPGVIEAIRSESEAIRAQNLTLEENQRLRANAAGDRLNQAYSGRDLLRGQIDRFRSGPDFAGKAAVLQELERRLQELNRTIAQAERDAGEAFIPEARRQAEEAIDPIRRLTTQYERMAREAERAAVATEHMTAAQRRAAAAAAAALPQTLAEIYRRRDAALAAERERQRQDRRVDRDLVRPVTGAVLSQFGADRSGVPINGRRVPGRRHQGVDLRGNIGDPVVAPEPGIARVGNAPGGLGLYIEIRADSGARNLLGHLSAANVRSGDRVTAGQLIGLVGMSGNAQGSTPHLHWQRQVGGQWVNPMRNVGSSGAAQAARDAQREAERAAEQAARDRADFEADMQRAGEQLLQARRAMAETVEQQLAYELDQIETDRQQAMAASEEKVRQGHRTQAEAQLFAIQQDRLAQARSAAARERAADAIVQQQLAGERAGLQNAADLEQLAGQLAETRREQLASALRLADLQRERELKEIEGLRIAARGNEAELRRLDARERFINDSSDLQRQMIQRQYEGPLARRMRELRAGAADINTQLEELDVRAMDALDQSARNAIQSLLGVHGALGDIIADLIMIFIRQQAINFSGGMGAPGSSGGGFFSFLGSLFGGGSGGGDFGGLGFDIFGGTLKGLGGKALGGRMNEPAWVGERGPEIFIPDVPGVVIPNHMLGHNGGNGVSRVVIELPPELDARIARVSGPVAVEVHRNLAPASEDRAVEKTLDRINRVPLA